MSELPKATRAKSNQDLAHEIVDKFTTSLTWRQPYRSRWDRFYKLYKNVLDETNYPWQSNVFIPMAFSTVETVVPRLVSNRPEIDIMPREKTDEAHAKIMSQLIDYQWDMMNMNVMMPEAVKELCIYGTVIIKAGWKYKTQTNQKREVADETIPEMGMVQTEQEEVIYDAPTVELVDLYDFYPDPSGTSIDTMKWCIHRTVRTKAYLKEMAKNKIYKNVNLVINGSGMKASDDDEKSQRRATDGISLPPLDEDSVELLEYWEDDRVVVIADRSVVIRDEKNPFEHGKKPFIHCVDQKVPHEFYGIGEIEPIETLCYELNDRRNQRMDNVTLILNRMWKIKNSANVDEDELVSDAGGVVHTDDMDGIDVLAMPDVTASSYQEEALIKGDIQQTSGVTDYTKGANSGTSSNDTATGISLLQEAGNARFRMKSQNIEDMLIKRLGEFMVSMNEQFVTEPQVLRIVGDDGIEWKQVKPDEIQGQFDVQVVAGSTVVTNEAVDKKQTMEMFSLLNGNPLVDQRELLKTVILAINPKANTEKLLPPQQAQPGSIPGMGDQMGADGGMGEASPQGDPSMQAINQSAQSA